LFNHLRPAPAAQWNVKSRDDAVGYGMAVLRNDERHSMTQAAEGDWERTKHVRQAPGLRERERF
jgi:hypothetical protein